MRAIKQFTKQISFTFSSIILLISCGKDAITANEVEEAQAQFSSRDIFEALYFYDGKLAEAMPSIDTQFIAKTVESLKQQSSNTAKGTETEYDKYMEFKNYVFGYIEKNHLEKLDSFNSRMRSGDHILVMEAVDDMSQLYIEALVASDEYSGIFKKVFEKVPEIDSDKFVDANGEFNFEYFEANFNKIKNHLNSVFNSEASINFITVLALAVAVVVVAVAGYAVLIGAAVAVVTWVVISDKIAKGGDIIHNEMMINDYVNLLAE